MSAFSNPQNLFHCVPYLKTNLVIKQKLISFLFLETRLIAVTTMLFVFPISWVLFDYLPINSLSFYLFTQSIISYLSPVITKCLLSTFQITTLLQHVSLLQKQNKIIKIQFQNPHNFVFARFAFIKLPSVRLFWKTYNGFLRNQIKDKLKFFIWPQ